MDRRETFGTRLGFILVSAGCAIGIGNVWKFPYMAGQNGGAVFVLFYLVFLIMMGIPVMTMEFAVGRASRSSTAQSFKVLEKPGEKWHIFGWVCMVGCHLLMMYYTTVSGWMVSYFVKFTTGAFEGAGKESIADIFGEMLASPKEMMVYTVLTIVAGYAVLSFGVRKGLERVNKVMMTGLLLLIVILAVNSITLDGAEEGLRFYLYPDLERAREVGIMNVVSAAMSQAFFTLSLGIGSLEIFGSYMTKEHTLTGEAVRVCALDTFVALISGLIIFPACFSYGVSPDQGPSLIFITLPSIFLNMRAGRLWGALFFVFMTFASFSTVTAVLEGMVAGVMEGFGWSRKKAIIADMIFLLVMSMPCVLGFNIWSDLHLIGGRGVLDSEDFIVSNVMLPLGSLAFLLFCVVKKGWGFDNYLKEVNTGIGMKMSEKLAGYYRFVMPVLLLFVFISGMLA